VYSRLSNPTRTALESALSSIESPAPGSCQTSTFSSGMAAVHALISSHLRLHKATHLILPDDCYHGVPYQLDAVLSSAGVTWSHCDMTDEAAVSEALAQNAQTPTILWLETPSNPLCRVSDLSLLCSLGSEAGATTVVDSTWSPPCVTRPLEHGADAVLHSATKYMGGHSDVLMGTVTCSLLTPGQERMASAVRDTQGAVGSVPGPFDCFLVLRGLRSMHVRVERSCQNAMRLAKYLKGRGGKVRKVHYPGLEDHPQHEVAKGQMSMFGGMLSFEVEGGREAAMAVAGGGGGLVKRATSLGGTETLIEHRASIEPEGRVVSPEGLLRVSVGIERFEDIRDDFERMLQ